MADLQFYSVLGTCARALPRFAFLALVSLFLIAPAWAQDEGKPNFSEDGTKGMVLPPEAQAVSDVTLASQLADYGQRADDPIALITAARILAMTGTRPSDFEVTREGTGEPSDDKSGAERLAPDPEVLLDAARDLAGDVESVREMIAVVEGMLAEDDDGARGRVAGPIVTTDRVFARDTDIWTLGTYRGREFARVIVDGDGDTDLDCYIYDEYGNLIVSDTDFTDYCVLDWTPAYTGPFTLRIRNLGGVYNVYRLASN